MRILIADDTLLMRSMLSEMAESFGHTVILAKDGAEALEKAWSEAPDIAIIDWEMPRMAGIEVCWHLRADPRTAYTHLILMTAGDEPWRELKALDCGADDFLHKPINAAHLKARLTAGVRIRAMHEQLLHLALTDGLTGILNRRAFLDRADQELARARRTKRPLGLVMADIDHFKRINDTHGHAAGDAALKRFVTGCKVNLRVSDVLGRLGGEEFAILLPESDRAGCVITAERLRKAVERLDLEFEGARIPITASFGITALALNEEGESITAALQRADHALYRAKEGGRNRVELE
ncbi:two-component system chemotaxis response regulator CheY [Azospirillum fermentarium]|uniref:diguanylate cyclase n=1 Tax=Azospirillum fermentarium TaxID=1233114 RepID=UPI002227C35E|nr:diguanylate cyclase [Azospirillum fermentarium]MCW2246723.1 two-component system chemotaxis response regulator CheY [Azospirillum fermentarium]